LAFFLGMKSAGFSSSSVWPFSSLLATIFGFRPNATIRTEAKRFSPRAQFLVQQPYAGVRPTGLFKTHFRIGFYLSDDPGCEAKKFRACSVAQLRTRWWAGFSRNAGIVHHAAIFERHIEVDPHENTVVISKGGSRIEKAWTWPGPSVKCSAGLCGWLRGVSVGGPSCPPHKG